VVVEPVRQHTFSVRRFALVLRVAVVTQAELETTSVPAVAVVEVGPSAAATAVRVDQTVRELVDLATTATQDTAVAAGLEPLVVRPVVEMVLRTPSREHR
jgi:enoyl reductase-like protein